MISPRDQKLKDWRRKNRRSRNHRGDPLIDVRKPKYREFRNAKRPHHNGETR